ncbi:translation initiation factor [Dinghuibacter silviterrae]|uniref:Translation initiation factor 1 (eIF-1/SUI1) n=1 Tax=Dinghuibacter silviterrae TaxID=1539049 RepID=A0A4R8DPS7_9BACT|nr:translation initiation factor [Dinghuibacter silviterrae]TDX00104.1 translation initiation factor 1 (eIF-1/SUI1) [Dinghuibacter silviterrae]
MSKKKFPLSDGLVYSTDPNFRPEPEPEPEETLAPAQQRLKVTLDTKHRAGKAVTLVTGFIGKPEDLEALGKLIKNLCGSGGSVKDREVIVQGDHRVKVIQWLKGKGYRIL